MKHPTLYKKSSTGKLQQWDIAVDGATIITEWGQIGGTIQRTADLIKEGKHIGRSNETTPEQQAELEAKSQHERKLKKDYVLTIEDAQAGKSSDLVKGGVLPMLAYKYRDHAAKIVWPAAAQAKLDGHRCTAVVDSAGKCTLWSRTRKPILSVPHIVEAIEAMHVKNVVFDGELYQHFYKNDFETITHMVRRDTPCLGGEHCDRKPAKGGPCKGYTEVQYHIYDMATDKLFAERSMMIDMLAKQNAWSEASTPPPLVQVETITVANDKELMAATDKFLEQQYEGSMVRNLASPYHNKKCYDLLKVKVYDDAEFMVVGVEEGRGNLAGHAVFVCETDDGVEFNAKMKGKLADLKQYWNDPSLAIGRVMTVQYQGFTKTNKVPRFPVALRFRKDI